MLQFQWPPSDVAQARRRFPKWTSLNRSPVSPPDVTSHRTSSPHPPPQTNRFEQVSSDHHQMSLAGSQVWWGGGGGGWGGGEKLGDTPYLTFLCVYVHNILLLQKSGMIFFNLTWHFTDSAETIIWKVIFTLTLDSWVASLLLLKICLYWAKTSDMNTKS